MVPCPLMCFLAPHGLHRSFILLCSLVRALARSLAYLLPNSGRLTDTFTSSSFSFLAHGGRDVHQGYPLHRETTDIISSNLTGNVSSKDYEKRFEKKMKKIMKKKLKKKYCYLSKVN